VAYLIKAWGAHLNHFTGYTFELQWILSQSVTLSCRRWWYMLKLWQPWVLSHTLNWIRSLAQSVDEREIIAGADKKSMYINNNLWSGTLTLNDLAHRSLAWSGDGREIIAGTNNESVYIYDVATSTVTAKVTGHRDDVNAVKDGEACMRAFRACVSALLLCAWDAPCTLFQVTYVFANHFQCVCLCIIVGTKK